MDIEGHSALVTGGGGGLGAATARRLAAAGAHVGVLDHDLVAAERIAREIDGVALRADVSSEVEVEAALAEAARAIGPARIVVNCAGIGQAARIIGRDGKLSIDLFERVVTINLIGTYVVMSHAARAMAALEPAGRDGERGVVVNTSSVAWQDGQIGQAAYAATKGAIASLTLPAARELARFGIRVAAIAPGLFETPMTEGLPDDVRFAITSNIPFPARLGHADEFARLVEHIVTNPMINGAVYRLDGAVRLPPK
jgi:NAD(P)-dependent dehydrogenase (short-subunit alcohol dehydrogenase family)